MRSIAAVVFVLLIASCEGPEGPTGPAGTPGAPGASGAANRHQIIATADGTGSYSAELPTAIGTTPNPVPVVNCYKANGPTGDSWTPANCVFYHVNDRWNIIVFGTAGWKVSVVILY